jgi:hypothetical protein
MCFILLKLALHCFQVPTMGLGLYKVRIKLIWSVGSIGWAKNVQALKVGWPFCVVYSEFSYHKAYGEISLCIF